MELIKGQSVIVLDTSNYKDSYSNDDPVPFKATVEAVYNNYDVVVTSDESLKKYELYPSQILECFDTEAISKMVSVEVWYEDGGLEFKIDPIEEELTPVSGVDKK